MVHKIVTAAVETPASTDRTNFTHCLRTKAENPCL